MNTIKLFGLSLVLAMLLSMPGVLAFGCNPESKSCIGNYPGGQIVQGHGDWLADLIASIFKPLSVSGTSTTTLQTYTYKFGYGDPGDASAAQTFPYGTSSGCDLLYQCGDGRIVQYRYDMGSNGVIIYPAGTKTVMSVQFTCDCNSVGKIYARIVCDVSPLAEGYYISAWSTVQAAACVAAQTPTPVPTQPPVQPTQVPVPTQPPYQPTQPPVVPTAVPTGTPLVTITSTPDVYGNCPPMPRADCITLGLSGGCPLYQCPQVQPPAAGFDLSQLSTYHVIGLLLLVFLGAMYLKKGRK